MRSSRPATRSTKRSVGSGADALLSRVNGYGLLTAAGLATLWEGAVRSGMLTYQYLPPPTDILASSGELLTSGELPAALLHTLAVTLGGWLAATVVGVSLGTLLGLSHTVYRHSMTSFEVIRAIPPITLVPAALLIFGFSVSMELVIVVYAGAWPLLMNTLGGVRGVPTELLDTARMLRMPRATVLRKIILPSAIPSIVVGLRLALSLCLVLAVVAEMVGNPAGLGHGLISAQQGIQPEHMFAYVLATGVLGIALNGAFRAATSAVLTASRTTEQAQAW